LIALFGLPDVLLIGAAVTLVISVVLLALMFIWARSLDR
jgi:hypothetical protein